MAKTQTTLTQSDSASVEDTLQLLSPRWTVAILIQLSTGKKRTKELLKALEPISAKTLGERLSVLRNRGLATRTVFREVPPRVEYELTKNGKDLIGLLETVRGVSTSLPEEEIHNWGNPSAR